MIRIKQKLMEEKVIKKVRVRMEVYREELRRYERKEVMVRMLKRGVGLRLEVMVKMEEDWIETDEYWVMICNEEQRQRVKRNLNLLMNLMLEYDSVSGRVVILDKEDLLSYARSMGSRFKYL